MKDGNGELGWVLTWKLRTENPNDEQEIHHKYLYKLYESEITVR